MTRRRPTLDIFLGILLGIVCNVTYVVTAFFTLSSELAAPLLLRWAPNDGYRVLSALFFAIVGISIVQLLYLGPLFWLFRRKRRPELATGLAITAGITFLLTATCFISFSV